MLLHARCLSAGQFTALHSLSVACGSKACRDFQALGLMKHLRQLHLAQFSFTDEAFEKGVGLCQSLVVLHLDSQQVRQYPRQRATGFFGVGGGGVQRGTLYTRSTG